MFDFTSALYLGLRHRTRSQRPWQSLTLGRPAVLGETVRTRNLTRELAALLGFECATLHRSTLHAFLDLYAVLGDSTAEVYVDVGAYPIQHWAIAYASTQGARVIGFRHRNLDSLSQSIERYHQLGRRIIIATDGLCPSCGKLAPIDEYSQIAQDFHGNVVLDDTQSLGVLGHEPGPATPYGVAGSGLVRRFNLTKPYVICVASLAKGFGVPICVTASAAPVIKAITSRGPTRLHSSPPSAADVSAGQHALDVNKRYGESLRARLLKLVQIFREPLIAEGWPPRGGVFPVQSLAVPTQGAREIYRQLVAAGVRCVPVLLCNSSGAGLTFMLTARHKPEDVNMATHRIVSVFRSPAGSARLACQVG